MSILIATPYSGLFADEKVMESLLGCSDIVELRKPEQMGKIPGEALFHCEINLAAKWGKNEMDTLAGIAGRGNVAALSFHLPSCYAKNTIRDNRFIGIDPPWSKEEMLCHGAENIRAVRRLFGDGVDIMVENNNDLLTDAYRVVTDPQFIAELVLQNSIFLLLDIAHARISAHNRKRDERRYFEELPLAKTRQVHLSRFTVKDGMAIDAHAALEEEDWLFFSQWSARLPLLRYVTVEYYRDPVLLRRQLSRLRECINTIFCGHEGIDTHELQA
jgi:uncharacterized protein (UPF0276 family)